jgi:hypothetical protein
MAAISYAITIRRSTNNGYVVAREDSNGVLHEDVADLSIDAALDLFKSLVLANPVPDRITTTVIPGA